MNASEPYSRAERAIVAGMAGVYVIATLPVLLPLFVAMIAGRRLSPDSRLAAFFAEAFDRLAFWPGRFLARSFTDPELAWHAVERRTWKSFVGTEVQIREYLQQPSYVKCRSVEHVISWLLETRYHHSPDHTDSMWSISQFEEKRKGDCMTRSLWAWKKLLELELDAWIVTGLAAPSEDANSHREPDLGTHVWVIIRNGDTVRLLETTAKERAAALRNLDDVRALYTPYVAVDSRLKMYTYPAFTINRLRG